MKRHNAELKKLLVSRAKDLRANSTDAERALWLILRDRRLVGAKFRRQHPMGRYNLDFYCARHRLAIEADGSQHFELGVSGYDEARTNFLAASGIRLLRFTNREILTEREGVLAVVLAAIEPPSP